MDPIVILAVGTVLGFIGIVIILLVIARKTNGRKIPTPVRTLWAGIRDADILCHAHDASDIVERLRAGEEFPISDNLVVRGLTRYGVLHGFGLAIAQSSDPGVRFNHDHHRQYFWLVEGWLIGHGIGPRSCIMMYDDIMDRVPDAPETWK